MARDSQASGNSPDRAPISSMELVTESYALWLTHLGQFAGIGGLAFLLVTGLQYLLGSYFSSSYPSLATDAQFGPAHGQAVAILSLLTVVRQICLVVGCAATVAAVASTIYERPISILACYQAALGRIDRLMVMAAVLSFINVVLDQPWFTRLLADARLKGGPKLLPDVKEVLVSDGISFLIYCGLTFTVGFLIMTVVLENWTLGDAIRRSLEVMHGHHMAVVMGMGLTVVPLNAIRLVFSVLLDHPGSEEMQHLVTTLFDASTIFIPAIYMTLLFEGITVRLPEGLRLPTFLENVDGDFPPEDADAEPTRRPEEKVPVSYSGTGPKTSVRATATIPRELNPATKMKAPPAKQEVSSRSELNPATKMKGPPAKQEVSSRSELNPATKMKGPPAKQEVSPRSDLNPAPKMPPAKPEVSAPKELNPATKVGPPPKPEGPAPRPTSKIPPLARWAPAAPEEAKKPTPAPTPVETEAVENAPAKGDPRETRQRRLDWDALEAPINSSLSTELKSEVEKSTTLEAPASPAELVPSPSVPKVEPPLRNPEPERISREESEPHPKKKSKSGQTIRRLSWDEPSEVSEGSTPVEPEPVTMAPAEASESSPPPQEPEAAVPLPKPAADEPVKRIQAIHTQRRLSWDDESSRNKE